MTARDSSIELKVQNLCPNPFGNPLYDSQINDQCIVNFSSNKAKINIYTANISIFFEKLNLKTRKLKKSLSKSNEKKLSDN